jgi:oxygen-dependent protoporphyrinogen oxidase
VSPRGSGDTGPADRFDVLVVGGGVAGLAAAYEHSRMGLRPLVLESADVAGGVVARHRVAGIDLDAGAESFAVARPPVRTLVDELGIGHLVVAPSPAGAWVRHEAGTAPLPAGGWLGVPTRPWSAPVRRVVGVAGSARASADRLLPGSWGIDDGATLGALVRGRMGPRVLRRLVEPVVGGVHAAHPDRLEAETAAPTLVERVRRTGSLARAAAELRGAAGPSGSAVAGLRGGMYELVVALVAAIERAGGRVRTGVTVGALRPIAGDDGTAGWLVETDAGSPTAPRLVVAVPGPVAAPLLGPVLPTVDLSGFGATGTSIALVTLVLDEPQLNDAPRGTGVLVASGARGVTAKALTHASAKWPWLAARLPPGRHVLRLSYGRPDAAPPADDLLSDLALADAANLLGVSLSATAVIGCAITRWPGGLPAGRPGQAAAVAALRAAVATRPGLVVVGSHLAGTGLAAVVADARSVS